MLENLRDHARSILNEKILSISGRCSCVWAKFCPLLCTVMSLMSIGVVHILPKGNLCGYVCSLSNSCFHALAPVIGVLLTIGMSTLEYKPRLSGTRVS